MRAVSLIMAIIGGCAHLVHRRVAAVLTFLREAGLRQRSEPPG